MAAQTGLNALPHDSVARICQHLDEHDIYRLACTCRGLRCLLDSDWDAVIWREKCSQVLAATAVQPRRWLCELNASRGGHNGANLWPPASYRCVWHTLASWHLRKLNDAVYFNADRPCQSPGSIHDTYLYEVAARRTALSCSRHLLADPVSCASEVAQWPGKPPLAGGAAQLELCRRAKCT